MWRNKQSQSAAPSASSGHVVEPSSAPKVPASSGSPTSTTALAASWLAPTMKVKGEISGNEDLLVDGKVEGPISVREHRLTVGHNGQVTGGLAARGIIIYGKVDGNRSVVSESIEIKKDASVIGDVTTRRIVIEDVPILRAASKLGRAASKLTQSWITTFFSLGQLPSQPETFSGSTTSTPAHQKAWQGGTKSPHYA